MKKRLIDRVGYRFGKLLVLERGPNKQKSTTWICKCDCGNKVCVRSESLTAGLTKTCGCSRRIKAYESSVKYIFRTYKSHANKRNLLFELSFEEFCKLTNGNCYYCGCKPKQKLKRNSYLLLYNGIDRLDNSQGYIINNCVSCCGECNSAKGIRNDQQFFEWIEKVYRNMTK